MADNTFLGSYYRFSGTAAGTSVVLDRSGEVRRIIFPANKTGTVSLYDVATAAGTAATNFITDIPNTVGSIPSSMECGFRVKHGLTVVGGGTTDMTFVLD